MKSEKRGVNNAVIHCNTKNHYLFPHKQKHNFKKKKKD